MPEILTYKGFSIEPHPRPLTAGGFGLDVIIREDQRSSIIEHRLPIRPEFRSVIEAMEYGFEAGKHAIDSGLRSAR